MTVERWKIKKLNNYTIPERLVRLLRDNREEKKEHFLRRRMKNVFGLLWIGMGRTAKEKKEQVWSKKIENIKRKKEQNFSCSWDIAKNGIAVNLVLYKPCSKKRSHNMTRFLNCFRQCFTYELQLQPCKNRIRVFTALFWTNLVTNLPGSVWEWGTTGARGDQSSRVQVASTQLSIFERKICILSQSLVLIWRDKLSF